MRKSKALHGGPEEWIPEAPRARSSACVLAILVTMNGIGQYQSPRISRTIRTRGAGGAGEAVGAAETTPAPRPALVPPLGIAPSDFQLMRLASRFCSIGAV